MTHFLKYKNYLGLIFLIGFIIYLPILNNGFVWDDIPYIVNNPQVHQFNLSILFGSNAFSNNLFYRPLQAIYFASLYSFFGQHAFFYHLLQLILHLFGTSLLFIVFCLFFSEGISFFLALVFIVHPINVESVAWIAATVNELYFVFRITAFLLAIEKKLSMKRLAFIFSLLLLSLLAKEIGFLFLLLILIYRYLFKEGRLKEFIVLGIVLNVLYMFMRIVIGQDRSLKIDLIIPIAQMSFWDRLLNIPAIFVYYLTTFIYPLHLGIMQLWVVNTLTIQKFIIPLFLSVAL